MVLVVPDAGEGEGRPAGRKDRAGRPTWRLGWGIVSNGWVLYRMQSVSSRPAADDVQRGHHAPFRDL